MVWANLRRKDVDRKREDRRDRSGEQSSVDPARGQRYNAQPSQGHQGVVKPKSEEKITIL
jgi:hypothetical protein